MFTLLNFIVKLHQNLSEAKGPEEPEDVSLDTVHRPQRSRHGCRVLEKSRRGERSPPPSSSFPAAGRYL